MEYTQNQLPTDVFNATDGDIRNFNGQQVRVRNTGRGTRILEPISGSSSSSSTTPNPLSGSGDINSAINEAVARMKEANAPVIQSLQANIPEVQQKYAQTKQQLEASQQPLEDRYANLLNSIKSQGEQDVNQQTVITNNELGKRGILGSSTMAQQEIQNATSPIRQKYSALEKDTALSREDALKSLRDEIANLTPSEIADTRAIQNVIAQLQSGAVTSGINLGKDIYSTNLTQNLNEQKLAQDAKIADLDNAIKQATLKIQQQQADQPISIGSGAAALDPKTGKLIYYNPQTFAPNAYTTNSNPGDPLGLGF